MRIFSAFCKEVVSRTQKSEHKIFLYSLISFLGFSSFYFINSHITAPGLREDFYLRAIATALSLILLLRNYWPTRFNPLLPTLWYITLIYTLPFFFTFMLLKNDFNLVWALNGLISLVLLVLVTDWISAAFILLIGTGTAIKIYQILHILPAFPENFNGILASYLGVLIYVCLFVRKEDKVVAEKYKSLQAQATAIAHEMRTPLAAVEGIAEGLQVHLPTLIHTQLHAQEKDPDITYISNNKLDTLEKLPDTLKEVARSAFIVVDMLLMNLKQTLPESFEKCSILKCFEIALREYSPTDQEKELISLETTDDFEFQGNPLLIKHVFFNLLKNALYYLKVAGKGKISIWTENGEKVNKLYFKDTGTGISKENVPHVFDQFFSRTAHGAGVGLAFCKMVMNGLGGNITCESVEGEFTLFTLNFPKGRE